MRTSPRGVAFLVAHEGIVPAPYFDSVNVLTYGIGHTAAAGAPIPASLPRGMPRDLDAALRDVFAVFRRDLAKYEADVNRAMGRTPLRQHEFDAAVSFHFNTGKIGSAAWVDLLKSGRVSAAANSMLANWRRPSSIIGRREQEARLLRDGVYGTQAATVWNVTATGKVIWKPVLTLTQDKILQMMGDTAPVRRVIRVGSRGADVREAQKFLTASGFDTRGIDGMFGRNTQVAAKAFQKSKNLVQDGVIGPDTWRALEKELPE